MISQPIYLDDLRCDLTARSPRDDVSGESSQNGRSVQVFRGERLQYESFPGISWDAFRPTGCLGLSHSDPFVVMLKRWIS